MVLLVMAQSMHPVAATGSRPRYALDLRFATRNPFHRPVVAPQRRKHRDRSILRTHQDVAGAAAHGKRPEDVRFDARPRSGFHTARAGTRVLAQADQGADAARRTGKGHVPGGPPRRLASSRTYPS